MLQIYINSAKTSGFCGHRAHFCCKTVEDTHFGEGTFHGFPEFSCAVSILSNVSVFLCVPCHGTMSSAVWRTGGWQWQDLNASART